MVNYEDSNMTSVTGKSISVTDIDSETVEYPVTHAEE